jgi:hypothetical protein
MVPARLVCVLVLAVACASGSATDAAVTLNGVVETIDAVHQTITLSSRERDSPAQLDIHYNSLTIVDTIHGPAHVDQLEYGSSVIVHGRRDLKTEEVTADRIVVVK